MKKLKFDKAKYGKNILIDTVDMSEFNPGANSLTPNFYTIAFLKKAAGVFSINQSSIPLSSNTILFIPPGATTNIDKSAFKEGIWIFFEGEFLDYFFNDKFFTFKFDFFHSVNSFFHIKVEKDPFEDYYKIVQEIHHEIRNQSVDSEHVLRASLYLLLTKLNRKYSEIWNTNGHVIKDLRILRFKYLLEHNIRTMQTVENFSNALSISKTYLNKLCSAYFGKPSSEMIKERLLIEAKKEIQFTDKDIAVIAYELNFSNPANFNRFFKKETNLTPSQFRIEFSK